MRKTLTLIGYNDNTLKVWKSQLEKMFGDHIEVDLINLNGNYGKQNITSDLLVVPSFSAYLLIRELVPLSTKVIFLKRTLTSSSFERLSEYKRKKLLIIDETEEMAHQISMGLLQLGIGFYGIECCGLNNYMDQFDNPHFDKAITFGIELDSEYECLNIGHTVLDLDTLIEIGVDLDLDDSINYRNVKLEAGDIEPLSQGMFYILNKINRCESSVTTLMKVANAGVVGIQNNGEIFMYNEKLAELLKFDSNYLGLLSNKNDELSQIPFSQVIKTGEEIKETLVRINGVDFIITVEPIVHSGNRYGAIAIIKKFDEEERKQHIFRKQLIQKGHFAKRSFGDIVGKSERLVECVENAKRMAKSNASMLISGESGVGKEIFAQAIHNASKRSTYQFVAINCGAIPESLLESELFGYEDGAFTGAKKGGKMGLFELAHMGTIFLDEIGEMPILLQKRLLRVLEEREIVRIGGDRVIPVDVRVIAATNKNIKHMIEDNQFREDLYYRINVLPLTIPPLRDRTEDIQLLIADYCNKINGQFDMSSDAMAYMTMYEWPGNIRELRNCLEYLNNLGKKRIELKDLPIQSEKVYLTASHFNTLQDEVEQFLLLELYRNKEGLKKLGRRSLCKLAHENGLKISEQKIRNLLIELEKRNLVTIFPGKSGTVITELGMKVVERNF